VFAAVASLGIDTVEQVLLYHVVAGKTLTSGKVLADDGAAVTTAQGGAVTLDVINPNTGLVRLQDLDPDDVDPFTVPRLLDLNKGNRQVAHGISYLLRPLDLYLPACARPGRRLAGPTRAVPPASSDGTARDTGLADRVGPAGRSAVTPLVGAFAASGVLHGLLDAGPVGVGTPSLLDPLEDAAFDRPRELLPLMDGRRLAASPAGESDRP
jgi:hypothetical protein